MRSGDNRDTLPRIVHGVRHAASTGPGVSFHSPQLARSNSVAAQMAAMKEKPPVNLRSAWIERIDVPKPAKEPVAVTPVREKRGRDQHKKSPADDDDDVGAGEFILSPDLRLQVMYGAEVVRIKPKDDDDDTPPPSKVHQQMPPPSPLVPKRVAQLGGAGGSTMFSPVSTSIGPSPSRSQRPPMPDSPAGSGVRFGAEATASHTTPILAQQPSPSVLIHQHAAALTMKMPNESIDLDSMYNTSDMRTIVAARQMRSEYHFVDPKEFTTSRASGSVLEATRSAKAGVKAAKAAAAKKTTFATSRPLLTGVQHLFPSESGPGDKFAG